MVSYSASTDPLDIGVGARFIAPVESQFLCRKEEKSIPFFSVLYRVFCRRKDDFFYTFIIL
jgi:hypothetical protein